MKIELNEAEVDHVVVALDVYLAQRQRKVNEERNVAVRQLREAEVVAVKNVLLRFENEAVKSK